MGNQDQPGRLGAQVVAARQRAGDLAGRPIETGRMPVAAGGERGGDDRRLGYRDRLARVQPGTACGGLGAAGDLGGEYAPSASSASRISITRRSTRYRIFSRIPGGRGSVTSGRACRSAAHSGRSRQ